MRIEYIEAYAFARKNIKELAIQTHEWNQKWCVKTGVLHELASMLPPSYDTLRVATSIVEDICVEIISKGEVK